MKEVKVMKKRILAILTLCALILSSCGADMKEGTPMDAVGGNYGALGDYNYPADMEAAEDADGIDNMKPDASPDDKNETVDDVNKIIENDFINTAAQPISTFSSDVDTASYAYFRKLVNMGYTNIKEFGGIIYWNGEVEK